MTRCEKKERFFKSGSPVAVATFYNKLVKNFRAALRFYVFSTARDRDRIRVFFYVDILVSEVGSHRFFKYRNCRFMKKARNGQHNIYIENIGNIDVLSD